MTFVRLKCLIIIIIGIKICDLEQNIWWGIGLRAVTALKQHNSGVIVDVAQPMKIVSRSPLCTLVGHLIGSKIGDLEQNIRFALLKSVLISLRGVRGKQRRETTLHLLPPHSRFRPYTRMRCI